MKVNDRIIQVDNHNVKGLNASHLFDLLRGAPDTPVKVIVNRPGSSMPVAFNLIRKPIHVDTFMPPKTAD